MRRGAGQNAPDYPSDLYECISVAATDRYDEQGSSHLSYFLDVAAPGVNVRTTTNDPQGEDYHEVSGTSFAAPHVSGVAGLLLSIDPTLSNDDIKSILKHSADYIGPDVIFGSGRINAFEALKRLSLPNTILDHNANGAYTYYTYDFELHGFFSTPGLGTGLYRVRKTEVRRQVTFSNPYIIPPGVWGQKTSIGYSDQVTHVNEGFCEAVEGTCSKTGCTLRTYVYELWDISGDKLEDWYPCEPQDVVFEYSVLGIQDLNAPSVEVLHPNGGEIFNTNDYINIQWHVDDEYVEGTKSSIFLTQTWPDQTVDVWDIAENLSVDANGNGSYSWHVPTGTGTIETHKIRIIAKDTNNHTGTDDSDNYFTVIYRQKEGPSDPPDPEQVSIASPQASDYLMAPNPNPFIHKTSIRFGLSKSRNLDLKIYDVQGRVVKSLYSTAYFPFGEHSVEWDGRTDEGKMLPSGIYFVRIKAGDFNNTVKLVLVR